MDFKLSFVESINDELLLESINDYTEESYNSLNEVPVKILTEFLYESDYVEDALNNVLIENINIEKV